MHKAKFFRLSEVFNTVDPSTTDVVIKPLPFPSLLTSRNVFVFKRSCQDNELFVVIYQVPKGITHSPSLE